MVEAVPENLVDQYGIVDVSEPPARGQSAVMQGIIEKPAVHAAPSNLAVVGRYILPAKIMQLLEQTPKGADSNPVDRCDCHPAAKRGCEAYRMSGQTFDCGSKIGYLKAWYCIMGQIIHNWEMLSKRC